MRKPRPRRTALFTTVALLAAPFLVVGSQAPAHAETYAQHDATGDVARVHREVGGGTRAPNREHGDITQAVTHHTIEEVVHRVHFVDLARTPRDLAQYVELKTPAGFFWVWLHAGPQNRAGRLRVFDEDEPRALGCGSHRIRYGRDVIVVRIPRSCLGSPDWVRAGTVFVVDAKNRRYHFFDNAHARGLSEPDSRLTPRILATTGFD